MLAVLFKVKVHTISHLACGVVGLLGKVDMALIDNQSAAGACAVVIADNKAWRNASLKADVAVTFRQPLVGRRGAVGELVQQLINTAVGRG